MAHTVEAYSSYFIHFVCGVDSPNRFFVVPGTRQVKTRYPATLQPSPTTSHAGPEADDKSNSEVQVPVLSKPFTSTLPFKLNNPAKFNPTLDVQTLNISPLKPKVSLLQNFHMLPTSSSVKVFKPFGGSVVNLNADLGVKNATKATGFEGHLSEFVMKSETGPRMSQHVKVCRKASKY